MFADSNAPPGSISPEALEAALVRPFMQSHASIRTGCFSICSSRLHLYYPQSKLRIRVDAAVDLLLQLKYCQNMLDAAEISRLVHTLDTSKDGFIQYRDMVNLLANK